MILGLSGENTLLRLGVRVDDAADMTLEKDREGGGSFLLLLLDDADDLARGTEEEDRFEHWEEEGLSMDNLGEG